LQAIGRPDSWHGRLPPVSCGGSGKHIAADTLRLPAMHTA